MNKTLCALGVAWRTRVMIRHDAETDRKEVVLYKVAPENDRGVAARNSSEDTIRSYVAALRENRQGDRRGVSERQRLPRRASEAEMKIVGAASTFPRDYHQQEALLDALSRHWGERLEDLGVFKVEVYASVRRAVQVDGMSIRQAAREFGLARKTIRKMLVYSVPPGYQRKKPRQRPKLDPWLGIIDQILEGDKSQPRKQRHTAKRIWERLKAEHGFQGSYSVVKDYVRQARLRQKAVFVPLVHPPGDAQREELLARIAELERQTGQKSTGTLSFKVSEKGAVSAYGMGRFQVTLYYEQWLMLLGAADELRAFLEENKSELREEP